MTTKDIHRLARTGDVQTLRQSIAAGSDINEPDEFGTTALQYAISEKQVDATKALMELGANVAAQDASGLTALHYAIEHKLPSVLAALLEKCPEAVSIGDNHGNQPLWTAAFNARGDYEMVKLLLRVGGDPTHCNHLGLSPLDIPKRKNDPELLRVLESSQAAQN